MKYLFDVGETVTYIDRDGYEPIAFKLTVLSRFEKYGVAFYDLSIPGTNELAMANVSERCLRKNKKEN